jgi:hypothetical protein
MVVLFPKVMDTKSFSKVCSLGCLFVGCFTSNTNEVKSYRCGGTSQDRWFRLSDENPEAVGWVEGSVVYFKALFRNLTKGQNELGEHNVLFGHHINCIHYSASSNKGTVYVRCWFEGVSKEAWHHFRICPEWIKKRTKTTAKQSVWGSRVEAGGVCLPLI